MYILRNILEIIDDRARIEEEVWTRFKRGKD